MSQLWPPVEILWRHFVPGQPALRRLIQRNTEAHAGVQPICFVSARVLPQVGNDGSHLYAVGDVRHDLDGLAQVVPAPLAVDDGLSQGAILYSTSLVADNTALLRSQCRRPHDGQRSSLEASWPPGASWPCSARQRYPECKHWCVDPHVRRTPHLVHLAGGHVVVPLQGDVQEALVVAEIQVGLAAVVQNKHLHKFHVACDFVFWCFAWIRQKLCGDILTLSLISNMQASTEARSVGGGDSVDLRAQSHRVQSKHLPVLEGRHRARVRVQVRVCTMTAAYIAQKSEQSRLITCTTQAMCAFRRNAQSRPA